MPEIQVILNPISGRGNGAKAQPQIEERLNSLGLDYAIVRTEYPGHAISLAENSAANGSQILVAAGGDGTLNETLNGVMRARSSGGSQAALALIPVGRGNDFGFSVGGPPDLESACQALVSGRRKRIDVGFVQGGDFPQGRYFGNGMGIGFDAVTGFEAVKLKRLGGFTSYIVAVLKTIFLYFRAPTLRIDYDEDSLTQPALMVSIMNGRRMGGGFMMAPQGDPADGWFDVCMVGQVSRTEMVRLVPRFMKGSQAGHPAIRFIKARQITVNAVDGALAAHADGETLCEAGQQLKASLLPQSLEIILPER